MKLPVIVKRVFIAVLIAALVISFLIFYDALKRCEISFAITLLAYLYIGLVVYAGGKLPFATKERQLVSYSVLAALLIAETALRLHGGFPLTYPETNGGNYTSEYYAQMFLNEEFLANNKGRKDIYHKEFAPYQTRDIANAEGVVRPLETYNALGFRGKLPQKNKKVILCLGDSFTEGACVTLQHSYPYLLGQYIAEMDTVAEVMNVGVSGNDPFYEFKTLEKLTARYNVSTAIFLINPSDVEDVVCRGGYERFCPDGTLHFRPTPWWERLYGLSLIVRLLTHNVLGLDYRFHTAEENKQLKELAVQSISLFLKNVIKPYCIRNKIRLMVFVHPFKVDLEKKEDYNYFVSKITSAGAIEVIDLYDKIKKGGAPQKLYYAVDGHFKAKGYDIAAHAIFDTYRK